MFKSPFSFNGRIRRLEYGISFIIYFVSYILTTALMGVGGDSGSLIGVILIIPTVWFLWAQGAKRCHDITRSGWMQIIPFYFLFLIFQDGDRGRNEYGSNPKFPEEVDLLESETLDGHLRN
jgi:uncharacterized membrane protein YhaH (DUF805 family)